MFRRRRPVNDPNFNFYVGRLLGASEVTSRWLQLQPNNPEANELGRSLGVIVGWFLPNGQEIDQEMYVKEHDTAILPPKP